MKQFLLTLALLAGIMTIASMQENENTATVTETIGGIERVTETPSIGDIYQGLRPLTFTA